MPPKPAAKPAGAKPAAKAAGGAGKPPPVVAAPAAAVEPAVPFISPKQEASLVKIREIWKMCEPDSKKDVPLDKIPTLLRALGLYFSEKEYEDVIKQDFFKDEPKVSISASVFEGVALRYMSANAYAPDGPEVLMAAWRALDEHGKGFVEAEEIREALCEVGEVFRKEELEAFLAVADKGSKHKIFYEDYVALMSRM